MIIVTGGAGFIGANFVKSWLENQDEQLLNIDSLTYASDLANLSQFSNNKNYKFLRVDINNFTAISKIIMDHKPRAIINFAAETHVDNSISDPDVFLKTNVFGTSNLLKAARDLFHTFSSIEKKAFRYFQISTDEVYGSLEETANPSTEECRFAPNNPYSASKASADFLVRAYQNTYGLPTLITHSSNNFGPFQHPEKLIPKTIFNALNKQSIPIYGNGQQIRDWIYVEDHCLGIMKLLASGEVGQHYNLGANQEWKNIDLAKKICGILDELEPRTDGKKYETLLTMVKDRPGHDRRYALDTSKANLTASWEPIFSFDDGLRKTIRWFTKKMKPSTMVDQGNAT